MRLSMRFSEISLFTRIPLNLAGAGNVLASLQADRRPPGISPPEFPIHEVQQCREQNLSNDENFLSASGSGDVLPGVFRPAWPLFCHVRV
jgi:hypothetical protein